MADAEAANVIDEGEEIVEEEAEGDEKLDQDLGEEVEEEDNAEDLYPLLDDQAENDEENQENYQEYLALTDEIDCQNQKITEIKSEIQKICKQSCLGKKDRSNLRNLHFCLQQELTQLEFMQLRAIRLQNTGAARLYDGLHLSTSLDEDLSGSQNSWWCPKTTTSKSSVQLNEKETSSSDNDDENDCNESSDEFYQ